MAGSKPDEKEDSSNGLGLADGLEANGGLLLIGAGAVLVALACIFASEATVAPIFAVFGAVMLILGAFYARIEGSVEATREGLKATVSALRRRVHEESLPPDVAEEALDRALSGYFDKRLASQWASSVGEAHAERAISEVQAEHEAIVAAVARWLEESGYAVFRGATGFDLIGRSDDGIVGVEVKVSKVIGVDSVRQVVAFELPQAEAARSRRVLAFPVDSRISSQALADAQRHEIELMRVERDGSVLEGRS